MAFISIQHYKSEFGELLIGAYNNKLCLCDWRFRKMRKSIDQRICKGLKAEFRHESSPVIEATIEQLQAYASGSLKEFNLPLLPVGTDFQRRVWQALLEIPYGQAMSYLELSEKMGDAKAIRAVAAANGANAISIIIPCHRIIGSNGDMIGYAGGLNAKKQLLELENYTKPSLQLQLFK